VLARFRPLVAAATLLALAAGAAAPADAAGAPAFRVTVAVVPPGTTPADLAGIEGMGIGLMSAGIGSVPPQQTYLDISQGTRIASSLYPDRLPTLQVGGGVPSAEWDQVVARADDAPANITPGLLGQTLADDGIAVTAAPSAGDAALLGVDGRGRIGQSCPTRCEGLVIRSTNVADLRKAAERLPLQGKDILIAIEQPPPAADHELSLGIAGPGFDGTLTSDSTRRSGLVTSTDLTPTILEALGADVPDQVDGLVIRGEGSADPVDVAELEDRLAAVPDRRGPVIGITAAVWTVIALIAAALLRGPASRVALRLLALTLFYLPAVLLLTAALEPSELAERLIVLLSCPALAGLTLAVAGGYAALAVTCGVTVVAYAVDVIAGSALTPLSLTGPNPAGGVRFYGIGNELEAALTPLVLIGTGAALTAWGGKLSPGRRAWAFGLAAVLAIAAFAPGLFGADVGAAIGLSVGAAVAIAVCLGARRSALLLIVAAPIAALALLAVADLITGGDSHLTRSVLDAGGLNGLGDVAQRRLSQSADSFTNTATLPFLAAALIAAAVAYAKRQTIADWFAGREAAWAAFVGACAATVIGTLANDSGAKLLVLGAIAVAAYAAFAWAVRRPMESQP
jgi:hypothetical protein